jgi:hypothetical protein
VFDPLAIFMLLAATESYKWEKYGRLKMNEEQPEPPPESPVIDKFKHWRERIKSWRSRNGTNADDGQSVAKDMAGQSSGNDAVVQPSAEVVAISPEQWGGQDLSKLIAKPEQPANEPGVPVYVDMPDIVTAQPEVKYVGDADEEDANEIDRLKEAKRQWKADNPNDTIHRHEALLEQGKIDRLPWQDMLVAQADDAEQFGDVAFGTKFPAQPNKGDAYIRVDFLPTKLFKWNGVKWIEVDKQSTDTFTYNDNYIDYLIAKIGSGEYDPDLLNDNEKQQIEARLRDDQRLSGQA